MSLGDVIVMIGFTSVLCFIICVIIYLCASGTLKSDNAASNAPIKESILDGVKAMGFSIVDIPYSENSLFAAVADQLVFSDVDKHATAEIVQTRTSEFISAEYRHIERRNRRNEEADDVVLHAIANVYDLTIEIIHADTLESRIIRPRPYIIARREQMQNIYIGCIGQNHFISLHKPKENTCTMDASLNSELNRASGNNPLRMRHEDTDGNITEIEVTDPSKTSICVGDTNIQYVECDDEYQKHTIISVNSTQHIHCKQRTPKEVFECKTHIHEQQSEFSGAEINVRFSCGANNDAANNAYERSIYERLQTRIDDFQHEVDRVLDTDVVTVKRKCILIVFMSRSLDSALQCPAKFFSKEFECVIRFMLSLADKDIIPPTKVDIHLDMKFQASSKMPPTAAVHHSVTPQTKNIQKKTQEMITTCPSKTLQQSDPNVMEGFSNGISIVVQPKERHSESELRLDNLSENLVKAALTSIDKAGILKPNTEVEVTLKKIACKCQNDRTLEIRPLSSQKGQGKGKGHRSQPYDYILEELDFLEVGRMTGIIKGNAGLTATAFRAGHNYVLTTFHFVSAADPNQMEVTFKDEGKAHKLKLVFSCQELDVALLEIQTPSKRADSVLYITDANPGDDIYIVGHTSKKNLKKERTTCLNWRNLNVSADCKNYILFHSEKFGEGSSGAPCLKIHENKLCVVSIVIGELLGNDNKGTAHLGVNMVTFYHLFFQQNQELCQTIFKIVDTDSVMCSNCGADFRFD